MGLRRGRRKANERAALSQDGVRRAARALFKRKPPAGFEAAASTRCLGGPFGTKDDCDPDLIGPGARHASLAYCLRQDRRPHRDRQRPQKFGKPADDRRPQWRGRCVPVHGTAVGTFQWKESDSITREIVLRLKPAGLVCHRVAAPHVVGTETAWCLERLKGALSRATAGDLPHHHGAAPLPCDQADRFHHHRGRRGCGAR